MQMCTSAFKRLLNVSLSAALLISAFCTIPSPAGGVSNPNNGVVPPLTRLSASANSWNVVGTPGYQPARNEILNPAVGGLPAGSEIISMASGNDGLTVAAIVRTWIDTDNGASYNGYHNAFYYSSTAGQTFSINRYKSLTGNTYWKSRASSSAQPELFQIAIAPDDPKFMAVTSSDPSITSGQSTNGPILIWVSTDAGQNWEIAFDGSALAADQTIRNLDISIDYGSKRDIGFVTVNGSGAGAWYVRASTGFDPWVNQLNTALFPVTDGADFFAIRFSPNYKRDSAIALVYASATNSATYFNVALRDLSQNKTLLYTYADPGIEVKDPEIAVWLSPGPAELNNVSLQLPSDFSGLSASLRRAYISLDAYGYKDEQTRDGVFRIDDTTVYKLMDTYSIPTKSIYSIAYFGTYSSGKLITGERTGYTCMATVPTWFTDDPTNCPIPCWYPALKPATGAGNQGTCVTGTKDSIGAATVAWNADGSLGLCTTGSGAVGTGGAWYSALIGTPIPNDESAFSITRNNGETWNQLTLIDTTIDWLNDVTPSWDGTTVFLASSNRDGGTGCGEFDSVWRSTTNSNVAAPLTAATTIGINWERVYCRATSGSCAIAQTDLPIVRVVNSSTDKRDGEVVAWAAQEAYAKADNTGGVMAWSPDFGDYWASITPRDPVQDFTFSSSTLMFIVDPSAQVQRLPYTGTAWSTNLPSYDSGLSGAHTIVASGNNLLVGASAAASAAGYGASISQDGWETWALVQQKLPTYGNVHVALDLNASGSSYIYAADDNGPILNTGSPHAGGSQPGAVYRNTFPASAGWDSIMSRNDGATGPSWWASDTSGDPPHTVGQFGIVAGTTGTALFSAHDKISLQSASGPAELPAASAVCYTSTATNSLPEPGIYWNCLDTYSDSSAGSTAGDTVRFTLEPSSLKSTGSSVLYAIDDEAFGQYLGTSTGYNPLASPPVRGCLWSYSASLLPSISVTSPNGTEVWGVGNSYNITWTSNDVTGNVKIQLSRDGGTTYSTILANTANDGIQSWKVTTPLTSTARVRVISISTPTVFDVSDANFTIAALPQPPTLNSPGAGIVSNTLTPTLDWKDSSGATSYGVQVSAASTFAATLVDNNSLSGSTFTVPAGILEWNKTYYWRANAANEAGSSKWSAGRVLKTAAGPPPNAPCNLTAAPITSTRIDLAWTDNSTNEAGFRIERKTGTGNFTLVATVGPDVTAYSNSGGLKPNTSYTYRIRAYLTTSILSDYTNEASATTLPPPPTAPKPLSPAAGATLSTLTPTLDWDEPSGAVNYNVQVSTASTFAATLVDNNSLSSSTFTVPDGILEWNKTYFWRANAVNSSNSTSKWSATRNFKTAAGAPPDAPSNLAATPVSATRINLTWDDNSSNEAGFKIERKKTGGNFVLIATVGPNVTSYSNTSGLTANSSCTYRVRSYLTATIASLYSNEAAATTLPAAPSAPTPLSPANGATNQSQPVTLDWNDPAGAATYCVQVSTVSTFTTTVVNQTGLIESTYTVPDDSLSSNTTYYWRVNAVNSFDSASKWSGIRKFKTAP